MVLPEGLCDTAADVHWVWVVGRSGGGCRHGGCGRPLTVDVLALLRQRLQVVLHVVQVVLVSLVHVLSQSISDQRDGVDDSRHGARLLLLLQGGHCGL